MEADIVEISPPVHLFEKQKKRAILHDVIDIDDADDSKDLVIIGERVSKSNKGKTIEAIHQVVEVSDCSVCQPSVENFGPVNRIESSNGYPLVSHKLINVDGHGSDDYIDIFSEHYTDVDENALLQKAAGSISSYHANFKDETMRKLRGFKQFDTVDDASDHYFIGENFPMKQHSKIWAQEIQKEWKILEKDLPDLIFVRVYESRMDLLRAVIIGAEGVKSNRHVFSAILHDVINIVDDDDSKDVVIIGEKVSKSNKGKTIKAVHQVVEVSDYSFCQPGVENFGPAHLDNVDIPLGTGAPFTWLPKYDLGLKKSTFKNSSWYDTQSNAKNSHVTDSSQHSWSLEPSNSKIHGSTMGSSNLQIKMDNVDHFSGTKLSSPQLFSQAAPSKKKSAASHRSGRGLNLSLGIESSKSASKMKSASFGSKNHGLAGKPPTATKFKSAKKAAGSSGSYHKKFKYKILRKFRSFKQFDAVSCDASDHHFIDENSSMKQHPENWAKIIQKEWTILEKDLPDLIFVRVYESRMDLLRAVIIGAEGTPYHDGLFFFDLCFPSGYPNVPPLVYSHSGSDSLNPNLYSCGRVCLSLLNTWDGSGNERWLPGVSTILQVLVSIQGLILNTKPFFNEPGYESMSGSTNAESRSLKYNEGTFIESLRTMTSMITRPPKNFEDFVVGHFISRAQDILGACNAYLEGAQVGCLVKGGVQDVDEGDKSCSQQFKKSLAGPMEHLVEVFARIGAKIGAKDRKKFRHVIEEDCY